MRRNVAIGALSAAVGGLALASCGSSTTPGASPTTQATTAVPTISATSFTSDFAAMAALKPLAAAGKGKIGVLLPDTQSSARYVTADAPDLTKAFEAAGLTSNDFIINNAQGSPQTEETQAEQEITNGATVLLMDGLDSGTGAAIEANAQAHGVKVIDYDRLTLKGHESYYVSFDNVKVGQLQGQGLQACISSWGVKSPQVFELDGSPTDNNATQFAQGYNSVLNPLYSQGAASKVGEQPVPDWDNQQALTIFQQQLTAHPSINAVLSANDGLANSVISALKTDKVPAKTVPTTGQDATLQGLQNILAGYQCMTVYKPIAQEAQAAAALAMYLRAGKTPPSGLVNGQSNDSTGQIPAVLLTPLSVTSQNMATTVVKDGFVSSAQLCAGSFASSCTSAGINP
jgi:D-xylose transport system substrate-binding protein